MYFDKNNSTGILHSALIEENLLEDLLELDKIAYERFLEILKSQGEIEDNFY